MDILTRPESRPHHLGYSRRAASFAFFVRISSVSRYLLPTRPQRSWKFVLGKINLAKLFAVLGQFFADTRIDRGKL